MKRKAISVILCALLLLCALAPAADAADRTRYVVLGDSIAYGSGLANPREAVYGKIVADTDGFDYENFAVPGHTTKNLLSRLENEAVKEAVRNADVISISIGGNNFLLGDLSGLMYDGIVTGETARFDEIAEGVYEDLGWIVSAIRALSPDAVIVLQTIYNPQTGYVGEVYQLGADRINASIKAFAQEDPDRILVAEVAAALTDSETDFAEDRIHPSAAGNEKIARVVLQTLYDNGLGAETEPVIHTRGIDARGTGGFTMMVNLYGWLFHVIAMIRNLFAGLRA